MVCDHPVNARDHARPCARAAAVEHADRVDRGGRCQAIGHPGSCASDVRAVAVAVGCAISIGNRREARCNAAGKRDMIGTHSCVNDVHRYAGSGSRNGGREGGVQRECSLINTIKTPQVRGISSGNEAIRLNISDSASPNQRLQLLGPHRSHHTREDIREGALHVDLLRPQSGGLCAGIGSGGEANDVIGSLTRLIVLVEAGSLEQPFCTCFRSGNSAARSWTCRGVRGPIRVGTGF